MSEALALLAYAVGAGTGGAAALRSATWPRRAPRLGVAAWQTLSASVFLSLLLAGLAVVVPSPVVSAGIADLLHACVMALRAQYATPGGALLHAAAATATLTLAARAAYLLAASLRDARRTRREHLAQLRLAARRDPHVDALIVEHATATAYCLPGRARTIVLTTAALAALDDDELAAVMAHERAHLRGRHHLVIAAAVALSGTVPFLPVFRWARGEQARLLEMRADDDAATGADRLTVARALVHLAEGSVPAVALGAADVAALARVERLLAPERRLGIGRRVVISAALVITAALPIGLAAGPAWAATGMDYCPISAAPPA